ncbi:hypothetical protein MNBD_GAMMA17-1944 [hydrothermal vent metagenome]|uniref:Uncharacterized protein n=1 Tax=hydrothermal vent metagenome TaxID=652676 RepID=A0A3B0Z656_9ZZZZ
MMIPPITGLNSREFTDTLGNAQHYSNHSEFSDYQLTSQIKTVVAV